MFAPCSLAWRRLMMELKPSFLMSGTALTSTAPAQAIVVCRREKLVMPGTVSLVTCCAYAAAAETARTAAMSVTFMMKPPKARHHHSAPEGRPPGYARLPLDRHRDRGEDACGDLG